MSIEVEDDYDKEMDQRMLDVDYDDDIEDDVDHHTGNWDEANQQSKSSI